MAKQVDWIRLHNSFYEHDDIEALSDAAFRAFVKALCLSDRLNTDGHLTEVKVASIAKPAIRKKLVAAKLWTSDEVVGDIEIANYLKWQRSAAEKEEARRKKSEAGRLGGLASGEAKREAKREANASANGEAPAQANGKQREKGEGEVVQVGWFFKGSGAGLPNDIRYELGRLLKEIGDHADEGTEGVLCSLVRDLSALAIAKVRESLTMQNPRDRAAYAVAALKSEREEMQAA